MASTRNKNTPGRKLLFRNKVNISILKNIPYTQILNMVLHMIPECLVQDYYRHRFQVIKCPKMHLILNLFYLELIPPI